MLACLILIMGLRQDLPAPARKTGSAVDMSFPRAHAAQPASGVRTYKHSALPVRMRHLWREVARITGKTLPAPERVFGICKGRWPCIGKHLQRALGHRARLERIMHPDTDTIRFVRSLPTLTDITHPGKGIIRLRIIRFGRRALREIRAALTARTSTGGFAFHTVQFDLRDHPGGSLRGMLRLAGGLLGPVPRAFALKNRQGSLRWIALFAEEPALLKKNLKGVRIEVLVNDKTASSAEVFAALLRRHAGARILGRRTFGKDWILRPVAVSHDWRLLVPAERIVIPGETLAGGLKPDGPLDISSAHEDAAETAP